MSWDSYYQRLEAESALADEGYECIREGDGLLETGEYLIESKTYILKDAHGNLHESAVLPEPEGPLYVDAIKLGKSACDVYLFLWNAAGMDRCRKIYNSNTYSIKGIAAELGKQRKTVSIALGKLLDDGLIQIIDEKESSNGSRVTIWGVTHPDWIKNVRFSISVMEPKPSARLHKMRVKGKKVDTSGINEAYKDLSWLKYESKAPPLQGPMVPITPLQPWLKRYIKDLQDEGLL